MSKNTYAYSRCKYAKRYDSKCVKCKLDESKRRPDKQRGPNACGKGCPNFKCKLRYRLGFGR